MSFRSKGWMYYEEDDDLIEALQELEGQKCQFKLKNGCACGKIATGSKKYCIEHLRTSCAVCGTQATCCCDQTYKCDVTLCGKRYCTVDHNIKSHINMGYMNMS